MRAEQPTGVGARGEGPERVGRWGDEDDPFGLRTPERKPRRGFPWKLGIVTGLVAAVIGAAVVTASELAIFGHSVSGKGRSTSVFGGSGSNSAQEETPDADRDRDRHRGADGDRRPPEADRDPDARGDRDAVRRPHRHRHAAARSDAGPEHRRPDHDPHAASTP